jgi:hypothetical protein
VEVPDLGSTAERRRAFCFLAGRFWSATENCCEDVMIVSEASIPTASAGRYMVQLCKHWSHKFPDTTYDGTSGRVPFASNRTCLFEATPETLILRLEAEDPATLDRMEGVVIDHLKRFAFREDLGDVRWNRHEGAPA